VSLAPTSLKTNVSTRLWLVLAASAGALALAAFLLVSPAASVETAGEAGGAGCRMVQVSLDEGYSVSRVEERRYCP